jgi:DNA-binding MarR family transcriptional regulator
VQTVACDAISMRKRIGFNSLALRTFFLRTAAMPTPIRPTPTKKAKPESDVQVVQRQISQRWTPRIAAAGWTPVADCFLRNYHRLRISHSEAMVIIHIMSFKWDADAPFPALKTIARRMGITAPSVRTHLRNLEKHGLLAREFHIGTTNRFHLGPLFERLENLIDEDEKAAEEAAVRAAARNRPGIHD